MRRENLIENRWTEKGNRNAVVTQSLVKSIPCSRTDDNLPGRAYLKLANYLMSSIIAAPAPALLLLVVAIVVAAESLVTSVLAALMTLASCLVTTNSTETAVRATLGVVQLLLDVSGVTVSSLLRLGRGKRRPRRGVGRRAWSIGLRKRWAGPVGSL